jgi:hypothetical protein
LYFAISWIFFRFACPGGRPVSVQIARKQVVTKMLQRLHLCFIVIFCLILPYGHARREEKSARNGSGAGFFRFVEF